MRSTSVLITCIALGCGSSSGPADQADAAAAPDAIIDTTAPVVESSSPAPGATGASLIAIEVVMSEALDPATVNQTSLLVADAELAPVPGQVSYDAERFAVVFTPDEALSRDADYSAILEGVADPAGNTAERVEWSFATVVNSNESFWFYQNGELRELSVVTLDDAGRQLEFTRYNAPGPDDTWNTADDVGSARHVYQRDGRTLLSTWEYGAPGPDGVFGTGDDVIDRVTTNQFDQLGRHVGNETTVDPGDDDQWGTADDVVDRYFVSEYDGDTRRQVVALVVEGAGADGLWRTADDDVTFRTASTYTSTGALETRTQATDAGADGLWDTADDTIFERSVFELDDDDLMIYQTDYRDPGADGVWDTADDVPYGYAHHEHNDVGLVTVSWRCRDPGADGLWRTADDVFRSRVVRAVRDDGQAETVRYFNAPGADGVWGTTDDGVQFYAVATFAANGATEAYRTYTAPGPDAVWFTADDVVGSEHLYDTVK